MPQLPFNADARSLLLPFDGCHNFREVHGWQTDDGRRLAGGHLFRSDGLHRLSNADHARLARLNIGNVLDLRASAEIARSPTRWPAGMPLRLWARAESAAEADLGALMIREDLTAETCHAAMRRIYARFPEDLAIAVQALGETILQDGTGATLVHCAAGKDRTGFAIAMLLHAIGIRCDDILADYLLSNASYEAARLRFNIGGQIDDLESRAPGAIAVLLGAHPEYLLAAEQHILDDFGSIDAWLTDRAGLDRRKRERIADKLLI